MQLTVTTNNHLRLCLGDFDTLTDGLDYAAKGETGCNFFSSRGKPVASLTYREIRQRALDLAQRLSTSGLRRGSRFAMVAETTPDFLIFFYACQYAGLIPVPLPISTHLGGHTAYVLRLQRMMAAAGASAAMASADLVGMLTEAANAAGITTVGTPGDYYGLPLQGGAIRPFNRDEPCYVQYSSGSTTEPRGVLVTQRAITSNARATAKHGLCLRAGDRATSWLPLYHDMGLVGFALMPMLSQISVDYLPTTTFALRPLTWLKVLSDHGGTISFSPTFGYELCARRAAKGTRETLDLSRWRVAGIGAEMVRPDVLDRFAGCFAGSGFDRRAFLPSYGLAEATLAVSFTPLGEGVRVDCVDRKVYELTGRAVPVGRSRGAGSRQARSFVFCGKPMPGYAIEIRDDQDQPLKDRRIGRICVRGPSLMDGYYRDPEATGKVLTPDGWLDTGDMGYTVDGALVVTGRRKDMIICNGRNIWPQDLEWAAETVAGVRTGTVAAFSVADGCGERVVLVVECFVQEGHRQQVLLQEIAATIQRTAGVHCDVVFVPPRSLTYTSSGKLSRAAAKASYLSGDRRLSCSAPLVLSDEEAGTMPLAASAGG